jgi:hypothetical protein
LPLVLLIWAALRRDGAMVRLLTIYWKVASLLVITALLFTDGRPLGYLLAGAAQLLVVASLWFWVDLNEELADQPPWRPLAFTLRAWRWGTTALGLLGAGLSATAFGCFSGSVTRPFCAVWLEAPRGLNLHVDRLFSFLFGGAWTNAIAAFVGYLALVGFVVGFLQWLLVRLPKQGRVAGGF